MADDIEARLRTLLAQASETCPVGPARHPSLKGGRTGNEHRELRAWTERKEAAKGEIVTALPDLLDEISRLRGEMGEAVRETALCRGHLAEANARAETAESEAATLRARVKELERALRDIIESDGFFHAAAIGKARSLLTTQEQH
jgi:chromosome segregation ATPase